MNRPHLGNKVVSKEDVGRSSQHGVRGSILHLGFEETVRRVTRNSHVAELWFEVYDGHCYLKVKVMIGMREEEGGDKGKGGKGVGGRSRRRRRMRRRSRSRRRRTRKRMAYMVKGEKE